LKASEAHTPFIKPKRLFYCFWRVTEVGIRPHCKVEGVAFIPLLFFIYLNTTFDNVCYYLTSFSATLISDSFFEIVLLFPCGAANISDSSHCKGNCFQAFMSAFDVI
jgi:hypothetical protein